MDDEYPNVGTTIDGGGSPDRQKENSENVVVGGDSLVRWCQGLQERAIRRELETEKFGITNRERAYFRKIFGYRWSESVSALQHPPIKVFLSFYFFSLSIYL